MNKKRFTTTLLTIPLFLTLFSYVVVSNFGNAQAAQTLEVEILRGSTTLADRSYSPNPAHIVKGDTIRFINKDTVLHTATSSDGSVVTPAPSGIFDTGFMGPNKVSEIMIDEVGEIPYYCTVHPTMVGTVKVSEASTTNSKFALTAMYDGRSYEVSGSSSSSAKPSEVTINPGASVLVKFDGSGEVELTFPVDMIEGISSVATTNGATVPFVRTEQTGSATTIKFTAPDGDDRTVVIMGARVVPEFASVTIFMVAGFLAVVTVAFTRIYRR